MTLYDYQVFEYICNHQCQFDVCVWMLWCLCFDIDLSIEWFKSDWIECHESDVLVDLDSGIQLMVLCSVYCDAF